MQTPCVFKLILLCNQAIYTINLGWIFFPQHNALRQEGAYTLFTHRGFVLQKKAFYMCIAKWMTDFMGVVRKEKKKK